MVLVFKMTFNFAAQEYLITKDICRHCKQTAGIGKQTAGINQRPVFANQIDCCFKLLKGNALIFWLTLIGYWYTVKLVR
jgi:hypothetical protein